MTNAALENRAAFFVNRLFMNRLFVNRHGLLL